jgi:CRP-like cAMP-binding protein
MQKTESNLIETSERVAFLNTIHLFNSLTLVQYTAVALDLIEEKIPAGKEILVQGAAGDSLYLIWSGKVSLTQVGVEQPVANYETGDFFGEESVLGDHHRLRATATTSTETHLLVLKREQLKMLQIQVPVLRTNILVSVNTHRLERSHHFKWLQENEVIYFLARKHPILLLQALIGPVLLGLTAVIGMLAAWYYSLWFPALATGWYLALVVGLGAIGWGIWNGVDWSNDFYIITDRRIVWVEKVIGIYESRQEAPLSSVQRVNVVTDISGRLMDYGHLEISTIVGSTLKLKNVDHPYQAAALIDEHWRRSKVTSRKMEQEDIHNALRNRLLNGDEKASQVQGVVTVQPGKKNPYEDQGGFINLFRLRFEQFSTVTYRKHIFVLLEQTWKPGLILFILLGILIYELISPTSYFASLFNVKSGWMVITWVFLFVAVVLWWIYEYVDWSNDIFQVTPEQIMDIDKTPLGEVTSDIASLENILSIESKRVGILSLLFNYGTVYITIGGGKEMTFDNVYNPSAVQEDIERRRLERILKKEQDSIKAERERTADWFAAYFDSEQQLRQEEGTGGDDNPQNRQLDNNSGVK